MDNMYLSEEKYQKAEKTISLIAAFVLIVGLGIGGFLIYNGVAKPASAKVDELGVKLENKKGELEAKGIKYDNFARYSDGEAYDLKIVTNALDPNLVSCKFAEYINNTLTKDYCSAKNSIGDFASTRSKMYGVFVCIATCMISFSIYTFAKKRYILAFKLQQGMPVAKEGINEIAPTIGNLSKEVSKGIKNGINNNR